MIMVRVLLLLCGDLLPVPTSPDTSVIMENFPQLDLKGNILYIGRNELYHWKNGNVVTLTTSHPVHHLYFSGSIYWVGGSRKSTIFDASGFLLGKYERVDPWYLHAVKGPSPIASMHFTLGKLAQKRYFAPLASRVDVVFDDPIRIDTRNEFAKATLRMKDLQYQFMHLWVVEHRNIFYVVDQLEPRVRTYAQKDIHREQMQGWTIPDNEVRFTELHLAKYDGMPRVFRPVPPGLYEPDVGQELLVEWWNNAPLIVFFGEANSGHVIAYRIPVKEGNRIKGFRLGVQMLSSAPDFSIKGPLLEVPEVQTYADKTTTYHVAGWDDGNLVLFWPNIQESGGMAPTIRKYRFTGNGWEMQGD